MYYNLLSQLLTCEQLAIFRYKNNAMEHSLAIQLFVILPIYQEDRFLEVKDLTWIFLLGERVKTCNMAAYCQISLTRVNHFAFPLIMQYYTQECYPQVYFGTVSDRKGCRDESQTRFLSQESQGLSLQ